MRKKKLLSILVVTAMTAGVLVGCGGSQDGDGGSGGSTKKTRKQERLQWQSVICRIPYNLIQQVTTTLLW